jgi:putative ABC transport system permease protein
MGWLSELMLDLKYGLRTLRRNPASSATVCVTLAIGIGLTTAIFSVFEVVLLRPLPFPTAERLAWVSNHDTHFDQDTLVSRNDVDAWRQRTRTFEQFGTYGFLETAVGASRGVTEEFVASVSPEIWSLTGARAVRGRLFARDERDVVVLAHDAFERAFGADDGVLGRSITLNGHPVTVVGVLARDFRFLLPAPLGTTRREPAVYVAAPATRGRPGSPDSTDAGTAPSPAWVMVIAKLRPGRTIEQARSEFRSVYAQVAQQFPTPLRRGRIANVESLRDKLVGPVRRALTVLVTSALLVLLIATTNIAHVLMARALDRRSEIGVRTTLGARRGRIVRQLVAENLLIAAIGCSAGLVLATWALRTIVLAWPDAVPRLEEATLNGTALFVAIAAALVCTVVFGVGPATVLLRSDAVAAVGRSERGSSPGRGATRIRRGLVSAELALATVLLIGAGLLVKSFWSMSAGNTARDPDRILVATISLSGPRYNQRITQEQWVEDALRGVDGMVGVSAAGVDAGSFNAPVRIDGRAIEDGAGGQLAVSFKPVSLGFLRVMGVTLLQGQWPSEAALASGAVESTGALLVNERFVRTAMGGGSPLGRHISGPYVNGTVAGVVSDFKDWQLDAEAVPQVFVPFKRAMVLRSARVVIRTDRDPAAMTPQLRSAIGAIDATQAPPQFTSLADVLAASVSNRRFNLMLLSSFAGVAVLLALVGAFGVIAYSVAQRRREIGVRLALGATPREIVIAIVTQETRAALMGIAFGLVVAFAAAPLAATLLYGVTPRDALTFAAVSGALAVAAMVTSWAAAARAGRVNPLTALQN